MIHTYILPCVRVYIRMIHAYEHICVRVNPKPYICVRVNPKPYTTHPTERERARARERARGERFLPPPAHLYAFFV